MNPDHDQQLMQQLRHDPQAFQQVYAQYFAPVYKYVAGRIDNVQDAEDVVSTVFIKALKHRHTLKNHHTKSLTAWLFAIARHAVIDFYRGRRPDDIDLMATDIRDTQTPDLIDTIAADDQLAQVRRLIQTLPERQREIIILRYFSGLRNKAIADILNIDERTVSSHLSRGLKTLHEAYREQHPEKTIPGD